MTRYLQSIFCDDIRHEIGGKLSYIGVYTSKLLVPAFPVVVPKLCVAISAVTLVDRPFKKFSIRILKDADVLVETVLTDAQLVQGIEALADSPKEKFGDRCQVLQLSLVFSPFPIEAPCLLRVRAETEDDELRGTGLKIEQGAFTKQS